jgi:UDP-N-acetylmuramoyl-tripeptide--D-alanyl-D-alanine ligase
MESMNAPEILEATGGRVLSTTGRLKLNRLVIEGVSTDSRSISPGEVFFTLSGPRFDGHEFVEQALKKGAATAVVSEEWCQSRTPGKELPTPLIAVPDSLVALQDLAGYYRRKFDLTLIAITGTNGKTTTKDMVAAVLSAHFRTMKTEGNFNNHIGVPLTLFRLSSGDQMAVVEMGMSGPGEIHRSAEISRPQHGLITNIGPAHLQQLKSLEKITKAKFELLEKLPPEGRAFLNADDERLMAQRVIPPSRVVTFGLGEGSDFRAIQVGTPDGVRTDFEVSGLGQFQIPTLGRHNVYNALAAIAVGRLLEISTDLIREALKGFRPSPMRMKRVEIGGMVILNDAYNANPSSMRAALEVLSGLEVGARKIAVLGEMLELGEEGPQFHRELGQFVARSGIHWLVTVGKLAQDIARGALQEGFQAAKIARCVDANGAAERLKDLLQPGDLVLLKGSRGVHLEDILAVLSTWFQKG